jgi:hypothetical protein
MRPLDRALNDTAAVHIAALFIAFLAAALWGVGQGVAASPRDIRRWACAR